MEFVGWHEIEATPAIILIKFMSHPSPPTDGGWWLRMIQICQKSIQRFDKEKTVDIGFHSIYDDQNKRIKN